MIALYKNLLIYGHDLSENCNHLLTHSKLWKLRNMEESPEAHSPSTKEISSMDVGLLSAPCSSQAHAWQNSWFGEAACWGWWDFGLSHHQDLSTGVPPGASQAGLLQIPELAEITQEKSQLKNKLRIRMWMHQHTHLGVTTSSPSIW